MQPVAPSEPLVNGPSPSPRSPTKARRLSPSIIVRTKRYSVVYSVELFGSLPRDQIVEARAILRMCPADSSQILVPACPTVKRSGSIELARSHPGYRWPWSVGRFVVQRVLLDSVRSTAVHTYEHTERVPLTHPPFISPPPSLCCAVADCGHRTGSVGGAGGAGDNIRSRIRTRRSRALHESPFADP